MSKKIVPVDKYILKNEILKIPGVWVCEKGQCIPVSELNKAIDDMTPIDKEALVDYIFKRLNTRSENDIELEKDLSELLTYNEVREYIGMKPLDGFNEYLEV